MKKLSLLLPALLLAYGSIEARDLTHGYRGFLEWSNDLTSYRYDENTRDTFWYTGLSTLHGYQFNPNLFLAQD